MSALYPTLWGVALVLAGCGHKSPDEPLPTIEIEEAKAVLGPSDEYRLYMKESHQPLRAEVLVDGAKEDPANFWPLAAEKRKTGRHTITVDVVLHSIHSEGTDIKTSKTVEIVVAPKAADYSLLPNQAGGTTIGCVNCGHDRRYASYDKNLTAEFKLTVNDGDTVLWQGKPLPSSNRTHELSFNFESGFADVPVANLFDLFKGVSLPLVITTAEGGTQIERPGVDGVTAGIAIFNRPTYDIGDPNKAPGADLNVLILSQEGGDKSKLIGTAAKVRDVDLIALVLEREAYRRSCGMYKDEDGHEASREVVGTALDVRVIDRRTGKTKGQKRFAPPPAECPRSIVTASRDLFAPVHGDSYAAEKYITSFVKPR